MNKIDVELCDRCEQVFGCPSHDEKGEPMEWGCVGTIIEPTDPTNFHDQVNTVRLCLLMNDGESITSHELTNWESQMISVGLSLVNAIHLEDSQPTMEDINK